MDTNISYDSASLRLYGVYRRNCTGGNRYGIIRTEELFLSIKSAQLFDI